jgi:predicted amidohydrolase YtcJ
MNRTVLFNANVITMDPARPRAKMIAIEGNRIVSLGNLDEINNFAGENIARMDCGGKTLIPGFVDAHCHVFAYAENLVSLDLSPGANVFSISDMQQAIRMFCKDQVPGKWIRGKGYNEFYLEEKRHPTRRDLDPAAPLNPVKLTHRSGHAHVLNSMALQQAEITAETGDPPGGLIDREPETGQPTGILFGMGQYLAKRIPALEDDELERGVGLANEKLLGYGITSVQDASSTNDRNRWNRFASWKRREIFRPRLTMMREAAGSPEFLPYASDIGEEHLRPGGVKIIVDQVTGSLQPGRAELQALVSAIHTAGLQASIHAIEEEEIEAACDAIRYALSRQPVRDHRHRIEHCSICPSRVLQNLRDLDIVVVTQPAFLHYSGQRYQETIPAGDLPHLYVIGSLLESGVRVGFGSDFPIADPNPLVGIQAAVTRKSAGGAAISAEQAIQVSDALHMYTLGAATANFEEGIKGSLAPGKLADIVMLNGDPLATPAENLRDLRVLMTIIGGKVVSAQKM